VGNGKYLQQREENTCLKPWNIGRSLVDFGVVFDFLLREKMILDPFVPRSLKYPLNMKWKLVKTSASE
tara:strand:+ start:3029 stop:3232 length:204 start_codon:yes stop_codon:yes gene_type:complete